jgi:hypothetical protein
VQDLIFFYALLCMLVLLLYVDNNVLYLNAFTVCFLLFIAFFIDIFLLLFVIKTSLLELDEDKNYYKDDADKYKTIHTEKACFPARNAGKKLIEEHGEIN